MDGVYIYFQPKPQRITMEVSRTFQLPKGTKWEKIERYVDILKLESLLSNKFRDPKKQKYIVCNLSYHSKCKMLMA